jgi:hypothetical protein
VSNHPLHPIHIQTRREINEPQKEEKVAQETSLVGLSAFGPGSIFILIITVLKKKRWWIQRFFYKTFALPE